MFKHLKKFFFLRMQYSEILYCCRTLVRQIFRMNYRYYSGICQFKILKFIYITATNFKKIKGVKMNAKNNRIKYKYNLKTEYNPYIKKKLIYKCILKLNI